MSVPSGFHFQKRQGFEWDSYDVYDGTRNLFYIALGNNPNLQPLAHEKKRLFVGGVVGTIYFFPDGNVSDIVLQPPCGQDGYAWFSRVGNDHSALPAMVSIARSLRCVTKRRT